MDYYRWVQWLTYDYLILAADVYIAADLVGEPMFLVAFLSDADMLFPEVADRKRCSAS
jgi:hypothetical protein